MATDDELDLFKVGQQVLVQFELKVLARKLLHWSCLAEVHRSVT